MVKIAIIGAGFSGLAVAWNLLNLPQPPQVTVVSKGEEASRISAGLLHKYMSLYAKLTPIANEAFGETEQLLKIAQCYSDTPLILSKGLIRLAFSDKQKTAYAECARDYSDVTWLENCQSRDPHAPPFPGIFVSSGLTVDTKKYLDSLQQACLEKGLEVEKREIANIEELDSYDHVVNAMGADCSLLSPFEKVPVHRLKGQLLEIKWPKHLPPLPYTIVSQVYIAMTQDPGRASVGATYEHTFDSGKPDSETAINFLYPRALELYPALEGCEVLEVKAGIRATTPNRQPIVERLSDRYSIITGMGSRGLLYHAYFAKKIVNLLTL